MVIGAHSTAAYHTACAASDLFAILPSFCLFRIFVLFVLALNNGSGNGRQKCGETFVQDLLARLILFFAKALIGRE